MNKKDLLPKSLSGATLHQWLKENAVETFNDEQKVFFTPDQITEFEHESSMCGRELNKLDDLLKKVSEIIKKGNHTDADFVFEIPTTVGTKKLKEIRRINDDHIDKGYEIIERVIYGVVDRNDETLEFFTQDGEHISDRTRGLSPKEINAHIGIFAKENKINKTA